MFEFSYSRYLYINTYMNTETQKPEEQINPIDQKSDEEKLREIIKKYSCHTKTYPITEWWDWDSD